MDTGRGEALSREARVLQVKKILLEHLTDRQWQDLATEMGCSELIGKCEHPLGTVNWGDEAYAATVLNLLTFIVHRDPSDLERLERVAEACLDQAKQRQFAVVTLARLE